MAKLEDYDYNTVILNVASDKLDVGYSLKKPSAQLKKLGECASLVNFEKNSPSKRKRSSSPQDDNVGCAMGCGFVVCIISFILFSLFWF